MSLSDCRHDIGGTAACRYQTNGRPLGRPGITERDVARASLMLRVNEPKVRTLCDGIPQSERCMGEDTEDVPHVFRGEILDHGFREVHFYHGELSSLADEASLVQAERKSNFAESSEESSEELQN